MDAALLLARFHALILRDVSRAQGKHYMGLAVAARDLRDRLPTRVRRRLLNLETAFNVVRHVTEPCLEQLMADVATALQADDRRAPAAVDLRHAADAAAPAVLPRAEVPIFSASGAGGDAPDLAVGAKEPPADILSLNAEGAFFTVVPAAVMKDLRQDGESHVVGASQSPDVQMAEAQPLCQDTPAQLVNGVEDDRSADVTDEAVFRAAVVCFKDLRGQAHAMVLGKMREALTCQDVAAEVEQLRGYMQQGLPSVIMAQLAVNFPGLSAESRERVRPRLEHLALDAWRFWEAEARPPSASAPCVPRMVPCAGEQRPARGLKKNPGFSKGPRHTKRG